MSSCLGLYIEDNIIKYAKVSKDHEQLKVDAFGTKFYDNIDQAVKQIIEETYSYKTPISINLSDEIYNYFDMFSLLSKKDLPKAIKTEFDSYCSDKNYNPNVFETRYAITQNVDDKQKLRTIHVSENKIELNKKIQKFSSYRLQNISPISMAIPSVRKFEPSENVLIVNIENNTTITTIYNQNIYNVNVFDKGSQEILDKINIKENSYSKAYEICKETTIYTSEGKDLTHEDTSYLEDIMPTLYEIVQEVAKIINESTQKISKVYITGTAALINNIDLYFSEYLNGIDCDILRPDFVKITPDINIKDYVEVNSAIALALVELGEGVKGMNFKSPSFMDKMPDFIKNFELFSKKDKKETSTKSKIGKGNLLTLDFNVPLDRIEKNLLRTATGLLILFIAFDVFSGLINKQIDEKTSEANDSINNTNTQIASINNDSTQIQQMTNNYQNKINELEALEQKMTDNAKLKNAIPNLLNKLMYEMPTGVQVTSIENTSDRKIIIQAQSKEYQQLGFLTAGIKASTILTNVLSTPGQKSNGLITIRIEGDLP